MNPVIFEFIKDENLPKPLLVLKRIGKFCLLISFTSVGIVQLNQGKMDGTPLLEIIGSLAGWSFMIGMISFAVIGIVSLGKTSSNSTAHAIGQSLKKIFLYMFLPAIVITLILVFIFVLPRYQ